MSVYSGRTPQIAYVRDCLHCSKPFTSHTKAGRYCSERCRTNAANARRLRTEAGTWLKTPKTCRICGATFFCTRETGPSKKYCSDPCAKEARRRCHREWLAAVGPAAQTDYNRVRIQRHGPDTLTTRLRRRYPDLPTECEASACNESRILEAAHRPEYKRNGGWRTMDKYERHMFWMLCPTCHRVLDLGIETAEELGLK